MWKPEPICVEPSAAASSSRIAPGWLPPSSRSSGTSPSSDSRATGASTCPVEPNPARDKRVRLPHEEPTELEPPTAAHVEAVLRLLPRPYRLALLWLDWSGARVASIETVVIGDYDEPAQRVRLRASTTKTRSALWVELPDVLAEAIEATLPPREDRDPKEALFRRVGADRLRVAIARACKAAGVPVFSPHDLRHRRISLLHRQGRTWAEIGRLVGQRKLILTADTYTHVLSDGRELDYAALVTELIS